MNKIRLSFLSCCLLANSALAQSPQANQAQYSWASSVARPDTSVPLDNWTYSAFDKMEEIQGILGCSLFRRKKSQSLTRYEFAIFTLRLCQQTDWRYVKDFPQGKLIGEAGIKDIIAALENEFQPEITQILLPHLDNDNAEVTE